MDSYFSKNYINKNKEEHLFDIKTVLNYTNIQKVLLSIFVLVLFILLFINSYVKNSKKSYNSIAITGDSYASYLYNRLEGSLNCGFESYFVAGRTIIENKNMMIDAMRSRSKYVIVSIGVNDHFRSTNLQLFYNTLDEIIKEGVKNNKIIFTHSYIDYPITKHFISMNSTYDYDNIIRVISNNYDNVTYLNVNMYSDEKYFIDDKMHLNRDFYDKLYGMLLFEFDNKKINIR